MTFSIVDELYQKVEVRPCAKDKYKVLKAFKHRGIEIEEGFVTNGADIPRFLWWLFPPNRPAYLPAVILHDKLCDEKKFKEADDIFELTLIDLEIHKVNVFLLVSGVRSYHYIRYDAFVKVKKIIKP